MDIVFCSSLGPNVTMAPLAEQVTQISMSLAAWPSDTNMVSGD